MNQKKATTIISKETVVEGMVEAEGGSIEVYGLVNGKLHTGMLLVHAEGKVTGEVEVDNLSSQGLVQGDLRVRQLLDIAATGEVNGDVRYGHLAMKEGGVLSADLKNIPPTIAGDLKMSVSRGKAVRLSTNDLTAIDPDDEAKDLTFNVIESRNGYVVCLDNPKVAVKSFTQEQLEQGKIVFAHDGKEANVASFSVNVTDKAGASSGKPQTVQVDVRG